jgi:hypothetical protein
MFQMSGLRRQSSILGTAAGQLEREPSIAFLVSLALQDASDLDFVRIFSVLV